MNQDDLTAKLAIDIEARKERDEWEAAAWRNGKIDEISQEQEETAKRLGAENSGVTRDFDHKRAHVEKEYQQRRNQNEATYYRLQNDLADGKLHHVWIDAKEEKLYHEAKKTWDTLVNDRMDNTGKTLTEKEIEGFEEKYGPYVVSELKQSTYRDFKEKQKDEQQRSALKEERARQQEAEQARQQEGDRIAEKKHELRKNGMSMTFDTHPAPRQPKLKPSELLKLYYQENQQTMDGGIGMT